jgi:hypothetical protein
MDVLVLAGQTGLLQDDNERVHGFLGGGDDLIGGQDKAVCAQIAQLVGVGQVGALVTLHPVHAAATGNVWGIQKIREKSPSSQLTAQYSQIVSAMLPNVYAVPNLAVSLLIASWPMPTASS